MISMDIQHLTNERIIGSSQVQTQQSQMFCVISSGLIFTRRRNVGSIIKSNNFLNQSKFKIELNCVLFGQNAYPVHL